MVSPRPARFVPAGSVAGRAVVVVPGVVGLVVVPPGVGEGPPIVKTPGRGESVEEEGVAAVPIAARFGPAVAVVGRPASSGPSAAGDSEGVPVEGSGRSRRRWGRRNAHCGVGAVGRGGRTKGSARRGRRDARRQGIAVWVAASVAASVIGRLARRGQRRDVARRGASGGLQALREPQSLARHRCDRTARGEPETPPPKGEYTEINVNPLYYLLTSCVGVNIIFDK